MTDLTLIPHAMAHGGEALARAPDGRAVFVAGGLPGETAEVRLTDEQARFARATLAELPAAPSPDRVVAPCQHFGPWPERGLQPAAWCGGCQWQHVRYEAQLRFKAEVLADALRRIGGLEAPPVHAAAGMAEPWHYRNQSQAAGQSRRPGLRGRRRPDTGCRSRTATSPTRWCGRWWQPLEDGLPPGEIVLRAGLNTGDQMIVLEGMSEALEDVAVSVAASVVLVDAAGRSTVAAGRPFLVEELAGQPFLVPATSFFQVNTAMAEVLVERVRQAVPDGLDTLVDVHSGVGTLAVLLAAKARAVYAIESDPAAVAAAVENAAGLDHLTLVEADAAEGLAHLGLRPDVGGGGSAPHGPGPGHGAVAGGAGTRIQSSTSVASRPRWPATRPSWRRQVGG